MRVADVMSRHVEFIEADAPVQEAAVLMGELDVGALPVGAPERLEGVLTDRDILYRVVARGLDCAAVRVGDVLTTPVLSCRAEDDVLLAEATATFMRVPEAQATAWNERYLTVPVAAGEGTER